MKVTGTVFDFWRKPHTWRWWFLMGIGIGPYIGVCLAFTPIYLPGFLALALNIPYKWLHGRCKDALWERPFRPAAFRTWQVLTLLVYLLLMPLCWYTNGLTYVLSKSPFYSHRDPKAVKL